MVRRGYVVNKVKLSVNIIVKNAADTIEQCLHSVASWVDEIVIVDTGSTDETLMKIKQYNVKLVEATWKDSFSEARNIAINHSTGDWILVLDADEIYTATGAETRQYLQTDVVQGYWVEVKNMTDTYNSMYHRALRLFRNDKRFRFKGRIHEQILMTIVESFSLEHIEESQLTITHYGYTEQHIQKFSKVSRNMKLLEMAISEGFMTAFYMYNLGVEYLRLGNYEKSEDLFELSLTKEKENASYLHTLYYYLILTKKELKKSSEALLLLEEALQKYEDYRDLYILQIQILYEQGLYNQVFKVIEKVQTYTNHSSRYVSERENLHHIVSFYRGEIHRKNRNDVAALRDYCATIALQPYFQEAYQAIVEMCLQSADYTLSQAIKRVLKAGAEKEPLIRILQEYGAHDRILDLYKEYEFFSQKDLFVQNECYIRKGQLERALLIQNYVLNIGPALTEEEKNRWLVDHFLTYIAKGEEAPLVIREQYGYSFSIYDVSTWRNDEKNKVKHFIKRCLQLQLLSACESILESADDIELIIHYAKSLYKEGYIERAGHLFYKLMKEEEYDEEILFYMGEMLFRNKQYTHAITQLERILEYNPYHEKARMAAAQAYLYEAYERLQNIKEGVSNRSFLNRQLSIVMQSLQAMDEKEWMTNRTFVQRGNYHL